MFYKVLEMVQHGAFTEHLYRVEPRQVEGQERLGGEAEEGEGIKELKCNFKIEISLEAEERFWTAPAA